MKAYIVSIFTPSTAQVTLTRVTDVPAGTGIVVLGSAGTYNIPVRTRGTVVSNMMVGVTSSTVLNKVDGANTNYIQADGTNGLGFYAVTDDSTLAAHKAYLPLPTASLPSAGVKGVSIRFDEGDGVESVLSSEDKVRQSMT